MEKYEFKFKYLVGTPIKNGDFENTAVTSQTCDSNFIKGNDKWISYVTATTGGGVLVNLKREAAGRLPLDYPQLQCHAGSLLDFEFMPHNNNHLATCSSDGLIKFWELPDDVKAMTKL